MRILVANRGEIARRVIRTARRMGYGSVAVFADPDADAPFVTDADQAVRLGPAELESSYLSIDRILDAALRSDAGAIHPGYGFLSENAAFARAVIDAGLIWIGPHPDAIAAMGSKIEARRIAAEAGIPVIPGFDESQDADALREAASHIGFPVLVKASAGGGGKGIRIVSEAAGFDAAIDAAREEARRSFSDERMIVERYITRPRHVEVQIVGDRHGTLTHLGTRECSVQRRYQKLMEEAPAPNLPDAARHGMQGAAVSLARQIGYDSVGTVEFVVDDETGDFFFLEMNTRLQVEHPVTEYVTGLDLVELQIRAAFDERLDLADVTVAGHAFEVRINAEDPWADFAPQVGTVTDLVVPSGVRWDSGVEAGSRISAHYDPLVAKLIVGGPDRESARRELAAALDRLVIGGVRTNAGFHRWLIDEPAVVAGTVTTRFLDETPLPAMPEEEDAARAAAAAWRRDRTEARPDVDPWRGLGGFRVTPHTGALVVPIAGRAVHDVSLEAGPGVADEQRPPTVVDRDARRVVVVLDGHSFTFRVLTRSERWSGGTTERRGAPSDITAPFPGVVAEVRVAAGDTVEAGQTVAVIEAMKMLHPLTAHGAGTVAEVRTTPGDNVVSDQILITFENGAVE
ncbi:MAG: biotin carboxylase N-terminal domain-containing protein [Acidimicrobiia bacterium]